MKDIVITFKVNESLRDQMKEIASQKDIPVSQLIREAIKKYIQEVEKNEHKFRT